MFKAKINDVASWKNSVDAIAVIIDEAVLKATSDGLKLRAMDPSQIAMVDFFMPKEAFESYEVDEETDIGINFSELNKITKRAKAEDKIELSLDTKLKITFSGKTTRRFNHSLIELSGTLPKEPKIDFTSGVKLGATMLQDALKDVELVSNHISLQIGENFSISAKGDTGAVDIDFPEDSIISVNSTEPARATYALEYFNNLLKAATSATAVGIHMLSDAPVMIEYNIGEGKVIYYLAPRIESI